jgi:hypothetical protein
MAFLVALVLLLNAGFASVHQTGSTAHAGACHLQPLDNGGGLPVDGGSGGDGGGGGGN